MFTFNEYQPYFLNKPSDIHRSRFCGSSNASSSINELVLVVT